MFIARLLPEELLEGYRGRLRLLNGLRDGDAVVKALNGLLPGMAAYIGCPVAFTELVARHNSCPTYDVVMRHSMWPFTAAIDRPRDHRRIEALAETRAGRTAVMRGARSHAWLCRDCVREDLGFWHLSYWRRSHQLPGALWCEKHRSALGRVSLGAIQAGPPDHCAAEAEVPEPSLLESARDSSEVQRFLDICLGILEADIALERASCASILLRKALESDVCGRPEDAGEALTELSRRKLPIAWRREVSPKIDWNRGAVVATIEAVCRAQQYPPSTTAVALVAALLFASSDDALLALSRPNEAEERMRPAKLS